MSKNIIIPKNRTHMLKAFILTMVLAVGTMLNVSAQTSVNVVNNSQCQITYTLHELAPNTGSYTVSLLPGQQQQVSVNNHIGSCDVTDGIHSYTVYLGTPLSNVPLCSSTYNIGMNDDGNNVIIITWPNDGYN